MKKTLLAALLLTFAAGAEAHEVWIERDASGAVRVYLGEPAEPVPPGGDPEFTKLQKPNVFTGPTRAAAPLTRQADHIAAAVAGTGDVRLIDDAVFAPWDNDEDGKEGVIYYARAGRSETQGHLRLELVPVAADADRFMVSFDGKPVANAKVIAIDPDRWAKTMVADANGVVTIPDRGDGRYHLSTTQEEARAGLTLAGQPVTKIYHTSTLTYRAN